MKNDLSRRGMIQSICGGLGSVGLAALLGQEQAAAATAGHYAGPTLPAKAKNVIFLFMAGGPSQLDMFDPKPILAKYEGQRPNSVDLRTERQTGGLLPSPFEFKKAGRSGVEVSELLPQISTVIDDICVIRSMYTYNPTHVPARSLIHSGSILANRPSFGAWVSYGLGSVNENLPPFVVLTPGGSGEGMWRAGFLPAEHQGVPFNDAEIEPEKMIANLRNQWLDPAAQRRQIDAVQALNNQSALLSARTRISKAASSPWKPPTACSSKRYRFTTFAKSPRPPAPNTARRHLPTAVSWRGAWWKPVCGSSTYIMVPGSRGTITKASTRN